MAGFHFELEALLRYREHQRDQCRQLMASVLEDQSHCEQQISELLAEREQISQSLRESQAGGTLNIAGISSARFYQTQLDSQKRGIDLQLIRIGQQLDLCRQALRQADSAVKALEQLREKRLRAYQHKQMQQEQIQLQEAWTATRIGATREE